MAKKSSYEKRKGTDNGSLADSPPSLEVYLVAYRDTSKPLFRERSSETAIFVKMEEVLRVIVRRRGEMSEM